MEAALWIQINSQSSPDYEYSFEYSLLKGRVTESASYISVFVLGRFERMMMMMTLMMMALLTAPLSEPLILAFINDYGAICINRPSFFFFFFFFQ